MDETSDIQLIKMKQLVWPITASKTVQLRGRAAIVRHIRSMAKTAMWRYSEKCSGLVTTVIRTTQLDPQLWPCTDIQGRSSQTK